MLFIMFFEFSLGPLVWVYLSEVMTEKGLSLGVGVNQILTVLIAYFTKDLIGLFAGTSNPSDIEKAQGSGYLFITCGGITVLCAIFCFFFVKETYGLSEREVANLYSRDKDANESKETTSLLALDRDRQSD